MCQAGELVQWDTSEHDWLEGRGGGLYPILMIDAATSSLQAWFVRNDSSEESLLLLSKCLDQNGRPLAFYTDEHLRTSKSTAKAMRRVCSEADCGVCPDSGASLPDPEPFLEIGSARV